MHVIAVVFGIFFVALALLDAYQTIILPRRPVRRLRVTRLFFIATWTPWQKLADMVHDRKAREQWFSSYGPVSLLMLIALWACMLVFGFGFIYFGLHMPFTGGLQPHTLLAQFRTCLYASGTTLFTLGLGDVLPTTHTARFLTVMEAGTGLGFVALVIGYVPVLYTTFSHREVTVALLDTRAGSPPTAAELVVRHNFSDGHHAMTELLTEWERWSAEMLETHISYPILCYYRSQHDNQSWLSAVTTVLDTCALLITSIEGPSTRQAQLTFAMARHLLVDLGHVFSREEVEKRLRDAPPTRLADEEFARLCDALRETGFTLCSDINMRERLDGVRKLYEPHAVSLASYLRLELPVWVAAPNPAKKPDVWTTVAGMSTPAALAERLSTHLSSRASSSRLHDYDAHG